MVQFSRYFGSSRFCEMKSSACKGKLCRRESTMPDTPISLFISYAYADSALVDRLEADLQKQGFDPWVDRHRLKGGQRWRRELQEAVEGTQVLLIVLSPDAVASDNVQIEYDYALAEHKVVIPLYYRQCNVPMELRAIQWIDFRHRYEQGFEALMDALHRQQGELLPVVLLKTTSHAHSKAALWSQEPRMQKHPAP